MKVLVADKFERSGIDGLTAAGCDVVYEPDLKEDALAQAIASTGADVLVVRGTKVDARMLDAGRLSLIVRAGAGYNTIDVAAASVRGIYVSNCPGRNAVANVADLLDRQLALLVDTRYNHGLPSNLSGATGPRAAINHGLKALQISVSAWTAEALKQTMPASVFSRSTECHNQDKVSMGTIAARDCLRVLELTEQVCAAMLIAARQGLALRWAQEKRSAGNCSAMAALHPSVRPWTVRRARCRFV